MSKKLIYTNSLAFILGSIVMFSIMYYINTQSFHTISLLNAQESFQNNETYIRLIEEDKLEHVTELIKGNIYCKKITYAIAGEMLEGKNFITNDGHLKNLEQYKEFGQSCDNIKESYN